MGHQASEPYNLPLNQLRAVNKKGLRHNLEYLGKILTTHRKDARITALLHMEYKYTFRLYT